MKPRRDFLSTPSRSFGDRSPMLPQRRSSLIATGLRSLFRLGVKLAPKVTARAGIWIFTRPRRSEVQATEHPFLQPSRSFVVRSGRERLAVMEWGQGPGVLGVHGWNSRGLRFSGWIKPLLDSGYRLVVFDAPGHGRSTGSHLDLMQYAGAITSMAEATGPFHAILAHSFGAAASLLALEKGFQVQKVIFLSALNGIRGPINFLTRRSGMPEKLAHSVQAAFEKRFQRDLNSLEAVCLVRKFDVPPSLICHDRLDPVLPFKNAQELSQAWKGSRLLATSGAGHQGILDDPEVVRQVVSFLAEAGLPALSKPKRLK